MAMSFICPLSVLKGADALNSFFYCFKDGWNGGRWIIYGEKGKTLPEWQGRDRWVENFRIGKSKILPSRMR